MLCDFLTFLIHNIIELLNYRTIGSPHPPSPASDPPSSVVALVSEFVEKYPYLPYKCHPYKGDHPPSPISSHLTPNHPIILSLSFVTSLSLSLKYTRTCCTCVTLKRGWIATHPPSPIYPKSPYQSKWSKKAMKTSFRG